MINFKPRTVGIVAAVVTIFIWTSFIVVARASAKLTLTPLDIVFVRLIGASLVLVPWGFWMVRQMRQTDSRAGSLLGFSPLPLRQTLILGLFGGLAYAPLAYSAFFFAPAAHGAVLMPGTLPLSTALVEAVPTTIAITVFALLTYVLVYGSLALTQSLPQAMASRLLDAPAREIVFQMLIQGVGSVVISGISFTMMVKHFGPVRSTMMTALVPSLASLAAVYFLGEPLYWNLIAGLVLALVGVVLGVTGGVKK